MPKKGRPGYKPGGQPGNKNGCVLRDPVIRQEAYKQFCDHIASGKGAASFHFKHPVHRCAGAAMTRWIKDEKEFDPVDLEIARHKCFEYWERILFDAATGKNRNANVAAIQMIMRCMFGWDRKEPLSIEGAQVAVAQFAQLRGFLEARGRQLDAAGREPPSNYDDSSGTIEIPASNPPSS